MQEHVSRQECDRAELLVLSVRKLGVKSSVCVSEWVSECVCDTKAARVRPQRCRRQNERPLKLPTFFPPPIRLGCFERMDGEEWKRIIFLLIHPATCLWQRVKKILFFRLFVFFFLDIFIGNLRQTGDFSGGGQFVSRCCFSLSGAHSLFIITYFEESL